MNISDHVDIEKRPGVLAQLLGLFVRKKNLNAYVLLSPTFLLLFGVLGIPALMLVIYSFWDRFPYSLLLINLACRSQLEKQARFKTYESL